MKTYITILFLSITTTIFSQEIKNIEVNQELNLKTQAFFKTYFNQIKAHNWNDLMDNMPKGFLDIVTKENLVKQMEKAFNNEAFTTTFNEMTFKKISSAFKYNNIIYANVNYQSSFTFHFKQSNSQTEKEFNTYMDFMAATYTNQFKGQKVERNKKDITISGEKVILVIDNPENESLKMIEYDKNMNELYKMFMPELVIKKLSN